MINMSTMWQYAKSNNFMLEYLKNKTICLITYSEVHVFDGYGFKIASS